MNVEYHSERCPQCGGLGAILDLGSGERVCGECGLVLGEKNVSRGPEWRAFNSKEQNERSRTGVPGSYTHWDRGLSTSFNPKEGAKDRRNQMWRLKKFDNRSKLDETGMRNLSQAMNELNRIGDKLHLPAKIMESAALLYRKVLKKDLIKGRTIDGFVAASIYAACRGSAVPRSLGELSAVSAEDKKDIARIYRLLIRELKLKMPVDYPMKFVPRIAASLYRQEHRSPLH
jgi:transcription initiation factor TFIIB